MDTTSFPPQSLRRFLVVATASFALIFGASWIWVACAPMAYLSEDYPSWLVKERLIQDGLGRKVVIIGDSAPGAGLLPARLGSNVVNLALPAGTPVEAYYESKRILSSSSRPCAIILSLNPSNFMLQDMFWDHTVKYGVLTFEEIEEVRVLTRELGETGPFGGWSPADFDARLTGLLYAIRFPTYYTSSLITARVAGRHAKNLEAYRDVEANRGQMFYGRADGSRELDHGTELASFTPSKVLDEYFRRTLELYRRANLPVYFLAMPHNEVSIPHYPPDFREKFAAYLARCAQSDPDFHVIGDTMPSYPYLDFGDAYHLNKKGAAQWSDTVAKALKAAGVPGGPFGSEVRLAR